MIKSQSSEDKLILTASLSISLIVFILNGCVYAYSFFSGQKNVLINISLVIASIISAKYIYLWLKRIGADKITFRKQYLVLPALFFAYSVIYYLSFQYKFNDNFEAVIKLSDSISTQNPDRKVNNKNIIIILIDTLRADHLSAFGYKRPTTPYIDEFARQGAVFTNAIAQKTCTSPSVASIFTGIYPASHGIDGAKESLPEDLITIAEDLKKHNYTTASIIGNANVGYEFNFDQGFEQVQEVWHIDPECRAKTISQNAIQWLENNSNKKFFLYIHYIDPHARYLPPPPYNTMFVNDKLYGKYKNVRIGPSRTYWHGINVKQAFLPGPHQTDLDYYISQYDGEIRYCDKYVGKLLDKIKNLGLNESSLIILTSDHGEDLGNHNLYFNHGILAYDSTASVPLIFNCPPDIKPGTYNGIVELIDLYPTIMEYLGLPIGGKAQGKSILPVLEGKETDYLKNFAIVEGNYRKKIITSIRTTDWKLLYKPYVFRAIGEALDLKLIYSPAFILGFEQYYNIIRVNELENYNMKYELYNIKDDPSERNNLYYQQYDVASSLRRKLVEWMRKHPRKFTEASRDKEKLKKLDKKTLEFLKSLGYL